MYDLTGHLSDDNSAGPPEIDPINLVKQGVFDGWEDLELKVMAEDLLIRRKGPTLHSPLSMKGRILQHQIGATAKVLEACSWGGRGALLADEVGLGKTIEAGLIISELVCRGEADKVLILTPASLTSQWRDELHQMFNLDFVLADVESRRDARRNGHSIWDRERLISSIDTAKQPDDMARIHAQDWDVVVVDEAHKLKDKKTQNFILVSGIRARVLLLLTATPMQNRLIELYNEICLIDPRLLGTRDSFRTKFYGDLRGVKAREPEDLRHRLGHVMVRNRRVDHPELELVSRFGQTIPFALADEEMRLYNEVTDYIRAGYLDAVKRKQAAKGYLMALYQRMLTSSSKTIAASLRRRMDNIDELLSRGRSEGPRYDRIALQEELASMVDIEYNDDAARAADRASRDLREPQRGLDQQTREALTAEKKELKRLVALAETITKDTKAEQLRTLLKGLSEDKVLVFTEFRATQRNLVELLEKDGHTVTTFHGGMSREEKDAAVSAFRGPCRVMVSTESGGEGRNLQFCHILVNYDLPWNPMRVEQRIGRLHRIGQTKDVRIINFSTQGTVEEHVLELLSQKIKLFEEVVGDLDLILGEVSDQGDLEDLIMRIISESKREDIARRFREVGERIDQARKKDKGSDGNEGARRVITGPGMSTNLDPAKAIEAAMDEQALARDLVEKYLRRNGARVWHDGQWALEGTAPRTLMASLGLAPEFRFDFNRPTMDRSGKSGIWLGPGEPLLYTMIDECARRGYTAFGRSRGLDPKSHPKGLCVFHIRLRFKGMKEHLMMQSVNVDLDSFEAVAYNPEDIDTGTVDGPVRPDPSLASRVEASLSTARKIVISEGLRKTVPFQDENSRLCDAALERVNIYFKDLEDELRSKEKVLEDLKFELVRKVQAAKDSAARTNHNEELKKANKRIEAQREKNTTLMERYRSERMDEIKRIESRRVLRPLLDLLAVGIILPTNGA